jgi:murein L,D-transpeptidase YcbB/YkuD
MVGTATLRMLNVPAEYRVRQIEINMERWRWMPESLGDWYLMVNIANQRVQVIENGRTVIDMRVIVGLQEGRHNTPVFSDSMRYVVINPYWHVPRSIVIREMLPRLRRDPDYLSRNHFEVFSGWGSEGGALDPTTVDWNAVDGESESFSYRFRQKPGPNNALGRLKFMFPNKYRVYLHDTPPGVLFDSNVRTFSHGCIRVERPVDLAEYLLGRNNEPWSRSDIVDAIRDDERHIVLLDRKLPVHVLYLTAWIDENGLMNFREDPYGRDKRLTDVF